MVLNPGPPFFAEPRQGQLAVTNQSSHPTGADKAERRQLCQDLKGKAPGVGPMSGYTEGQEPQASALSTCKALGHILPGALHLLDNHSRREGERQSSASPFTWATELRVAEPLAPHHTDPGFLIQVYLTPKSPGNNQYTQQ